MKSQENITTSQYFWLKKGSLIRVFFYLTLELAFYLYIEKQKKHRQEWKNQFFSDISKDAIRSYLKISYT